jgi:hypothetical protein
MQRDRKTPRPFIGSCPTSPWSDESSMQRHAAASISSPLPALDCSGRNPAGEAWPIKIRGVDQFCDILRSSFGFPPLQFDGSFAGFLYLRFLRSGSDEKPWRAPKVPPVGERGSGIAFAKYRTIDREGMWKRLHLMVGAENASHNIAQLITRASGERRSSRQGEYCDICDIVRISYISSSTSPPLRLIAQSFFPEHDGILRTPEIAKCRKYRTIDRGRNRKRVRPMLRGEKRFAKYRTIDRWVGKPATIDE